MKNFLPLLAVLAIPHFALAQSMSAPMTAPAPAPEKPKATDLPEAQQLLDHLYAPYEAAKTYRGTFNIKLEGKDPKQPVPFSSLYIETLYRFNASGDKSGEVTTYRVVGKENGQEKTHTLRFVDDGRVAHLVYLEQKAWFSGGGGALPILREQLQTTLEQVVEGLHQDHGFVAGISKGVDAGREVYILGDEEGQANLSFRAVVDAQTRALRALYLSSDAITVSISGSRQTFDAPALDSEFKWTPPAGFKQVKEGSIALPSFLTQSKSQPAPHN